MTYWSLTCDSCQEPIVDSDHARIHQAQFTSFRTRRRVYRSYCVELLCRQCAAREYERFDKKNAEYKARRYQL